MLPPQITDSLCAQRGKGKAVDDRIALRNALEHLVDFGFASVVPGLADDQQNFRAIFGAPFEKLYRVRNCVENRRPVIAGRF